MPIPNLIAMAVGFFMAAVGALGIAAPSVLLEFARSLQSPGALYVIAAVRIVLGVVLILAAPDSRMPRTLRVLGAFIILAGLATPFFGVDRSRGMTEWWTTQGSGAARAWPIIAIGVGLFISYISAPRPSGT